MNNFPAKFVDYFISRKKRILRKNPCDIGGAKEPGMMFQLPFRKNED